MDAPFWKTKTLAQMSEHEWESLCDGCAKCCLHKLQDEDTGRVYLTVVACRLLDIERCRCSDYASRTRRVAGCVRIRPDNVHALALPHTCAYRLLAEGHELPNWHPLATGDASSTRAADASVAGWAVPEDQVPASDLEDFICEELARGRDDARG